MIDNRRPAPLQSWVGRGIAAFAVLGIVVAVATPFIVWWTIHGLEQEAVQRATRIGDAALASRMRMAFAEETFVYFVGMVGIAAVIAVGLGRILIALVKDGVRR